MIFDIKGRSINQSTNRKFLLLGAFSVGAFAISLAAMRKLLAASAGGEYYSHIILIPLVSAYLIYQRRREIFYQADCLYLPGGALSGIGAALYAFGFSHLAGLNQNDYVSFLTVSVTVFWAGGFLLLYGVKGFQKASFPILLLLFMVPVPSSLMDKIIYALQIGSTEASEILFILTGIPFQREGFVFHLPGVSIEVAQQCSGIRSTLALLITSILAGHLFLDRFWKKTVLAILVFPVTVFKNGIRIVTLSLLGAYVDERWLTESFLHHSGGFVFFIPALGFLGLALWSLRRGGIKETGGGSESLGNH